MGYSRAIPPSVWLDQVACSGGGLLSRASQEKSPKGLTAPMRLAIGHPVQLRHGRGVVGLGEDCPYDGDHGTGG